MKGVSHFAIREWMVGMVTGSLGPKIGARRREQVQKEGALAERTMASARAWRGLRTKHSKQ